MPDTSGTVTAGVYPVGYKQGAGGTDPWAQYVVPVKDRLVSYRGRATTFRTPGRAGTTGQKIMALHNATGSSVLVDVEQVTVDLVQTVIKAVTVLPPIIRVSRFTTLPTNGTAVTKAPEDTSLTSSASVTTWQDASAEGTSSASALTVTAGAGLTQEYAPRFVTAAGYEPADRIEFLGAGPITLRALEGVVLELVYTLATQNPVTDMWACTCKWSEYTRP